jgi:hypothetical protein|tara:strand:- start:65 stop:199 length:135 start_codon:yes stop_codon:yes gene_type:complete
LLLFSPASSESSEGSEGYEDGEDYEGSDHSLGGEETKWENARGC